MSTASTLSSAANTLADLVPELVTEHQPAVDAITGNWSKIFSFVLSFVVIGYIVLWLRGRRAAGK